MTKLSSATITVAAAGPNKRTAAKTNASETENRAATEGTFTEKEPVNNVKPAKTSHCIEIGSITNLMTEAAITTMPIAMTL